MCRRQVVKRVSPALVLREIAPQMGRLLEKGLVDVHTEVRNVGSEGLVEPQIVPPFHGSKVAEPLVTPEINISCEIGRTIRVESR